MVCLHYRHQHFLNLEQTPGHEATHWHWIKDGQTKIWGFTSSQKELSTDGTNYRQVYRLPNVTSVNAFKAQLQYKSFNLRRSAFLWTPAVSEEPHGHPRSSSWLGFLVGVTNQVNDQVNRHFGPEELNDWGPKWPRTEVDVQIFPCGAVNFSWRARR